MRPHLFSAWGCVILLFGLLMGCKSAGLPRIRTEPFERRLRPIPTDAAPIFSWEGSRTGLKTYWGDQTITVKVKAFFPENWGQAGDCYWNVAAQNGEGKPIPFLGVVREQVTEDGRRETFLIPPLDLAKTPNGLYLVIVPNVKKEGERIVSIEPVAVLHEVRGHMFKPFRVPIPLVPLQDSPLTPAPRILSHPAGTPIPAD